MAGTPSIEERRDEHPEVVEHFSPLRRPGRDVLRSGGLAAVFTLKDFKLTEIMNRIVDLVRFARGLGNDGSMLQ